MLGISPMPSSKKARLAMFALLDEALAITDDQLNNGPILELGSGWGSLLIPLSKKYPQRTIVGYELSVIPWLVSLLLIKILKLNNVSVHRQNFQKVNFKKAGVILCYLYPGAMDKIDEALIKNKPMTGQGESQNSRYLISNNFSLPSHEPIKVTELNDLYKSPVYLYKI